MEEEQVSLEECRNAACSCRDEVKKAEVQLELNLARDTENN